MARHCIVLRWASLNLCQKNAGIVGRDCQRFTTRQLRTCSLSVQVVSGNDTSLFCSQASDGIGGGRADSLVADGDNGDEHGQQGGRRKYPPADIDAESKIL